MSDEQRRWTPADIAAYDQSLKGTEAQVDALVQAFRAQVPRDGERQAMVDLASVLIEQKNLEVVALLTVAIRRLSGEARYA